MMIGPMIMGVERAVVVPRLYRRPGSCWSFGKGGETGEPSDCPQRSCPPLSLREGRDMLAFRMLVVCGLVTAGISAACAETSPYAGMQSRGLRALSQQQIEDLRAGRGMGMALAASSTAIRDRTTYSISRALSISLRTSAAARKRSSRRCRRRL
jgi:hypothetical protein